MSLPNDLSNGLSNDSRVQVKTTLKPFLSLDPLIPEAKGKTL